MPRARRVLLVSEDDVYPHTVGGMEIRGWEVAEALGRDLDVLVLTRRGVRDPAGRFDPIDLDGSGVARLARPMGWRAARRARQLWARAVLPRRTRALVTRFRPDVVYFNQFETLEPALLEGLLLHASGVVCRFGNSLGDRLLDTLIRLHRAGRGPARVSLVFNCDFLRRYYEGQGPDEFGRRRGAGCPDALRSHVVYDGVDTHRFHPAPTPDPPVFVFLGRTVHPNKGFLDFCRVMATLPEPLIGGIEIIGQGEELEPGVELIRSAGRAHLLRGVGPASREEAAARLRTGAILALPTRDEGLSAAVMEAMASGLAVVAARVAGIPEVVEDGVTGLLVPRADFEAFRDACRRLAQDVALRARLGAAGRTHVVAHFQRGAGLAQLLRVSHETFGIGRTATASNLVDSVTTEHRVP